MNYEQRNAENDESIKALDGVTKAGQDLGLWTATERKSYDGVRSAWQDVRDADGRLFTLAAGGWNHEGQITATVANVTSDGITVRPSEVVPYRDTVVSAAASRKRAPEVIAKDLARRVIKDPTAIEQADKVAEHLAQRLKQRAKLHVVRDRVVSLGYTVKELARDESYKGSAWGRGDLPSVSFTFDGAVTLDYAPRVDLDRLPALLAILKRD